MSNLQLQLEDLILRSRALTLEEKQDLLKKLDTIPEEKKAQMKTILEKESTMLQKLDDVALTAIQSFTQNLKLITQELPVNG